MAGHTVSEKTEGISVNGNLPGEIPSVREERHGTGYFPSLHSPLGHQPSCQGLICKPTRVTEHHILVARGEFLLHTDWDRHCTDMRQSVPDCRYGSELVSWHRMEIRSILISSFFHNLQKTLLLHSVDGGLQGGSRSYKQPSEMLPISKQGAMQKRFIQQTCLLCCVYSLQSS